MGTLGWEIETVTGRRRPQGLYVSAPEAGAPTSSHDAMHGQMSISNGALIEEYLETMCPEGDVQIHPETGQVSMEYAGGGDHHGSCSGLQDMIETENRWDIEVDDVEWPHTLPQNDTEGRHDHAHAEGAGTGGVVTAPSPNSSHIWGAATVTGENEEIPPWLVLGHELLGHAWMMDQGTHPDGSIARGEGGHANTVARENMIRGEHGMDLRGGHLDPMCGESYWIDRNDPTGERQWSPFVETCEDWRESYNEEHGTRYDLEDRMPR